MECRDCASEVSLFFFQIKVNKNVFFTKEKKYCKTDVKGLFCILRPSSRKNQILRSLCASHVVQSKGKVLIKNTEVMDGNIYDAVVLIA